MTKLMQRFFRPTRAGISTPSNPKPVNETASQDEIKLPGLCSPTSAEIEDKPLELKRICMFKVLETYLAFQEIRYPQRNHELGKLFHDLSYIKIISAAMMPLRLIADNLHSILEDIQNMVTPDNITGLLSMNACLKAGLPTSSTESESAEVSSPHSYYSQLELASPQLPDPLVPANSQGMNMTLKRYLSIISASENDLYFDTRLNKWINAALSLEALADAQNAHVFGSLL